MLSLDDPLWSKLKGGRRTLYDPRSALFRLEAGDAGSAWAELWDNLHHQNDVDEASYAAVPQLVRIGAGRFEDDWNFYALLSTIELCRVQYKNPPLPAWITSDYAAAWEQVTQLVQQKIGTATDTTLVASLFEALAISKKLYSLATMASLTEDERDELLKKMNEA